MLKQLLSASYRTFGIGHVPFRSCCGWGLWCLRSLVSVVWSYVMLMVVCLCASSASAPGSVGFSLAWL